MVAPELGFISSFDILPIAIPILIFLLIFTLMRRTHPTEELAGVSRGASASLRVSSGDFTFDPAGRERLKQAVSTSEAAVRGEYVEELKEAKLIEEIADSFDKAAIVFVRANSEGFSDESQKEVFTQCFDQFKLKVQAAESHFRNLKAEEMLVVQTHNALAANVGGNPKREIKDLIQKIVQQQQIVIQKTIDVQTLVMGIDSETKQQNFFGPLELIRSIHGFPVTISTILYNNDNLSKYLTIMAQALKVIGEKNSGLIHRAVKAQSEAVSANKEVYRLVEKVKSQL